MALLFYSPDEDAQAWRRALLRRLPDLDFRAWPDVRDLTEIDVALVWRVPAGLLRTLTNLRVVLSLGAGVDAMLADPTLPDLPLCRLVDPSLTRQMSEFVLLHVLKYHRGLDVYAAQQRRGMWRFQLPPPPEATRVGIMGLGELGADAARVLCGHGFAVRGWSRARKQLAGVACFAGASELAEFLHQTDILVCLLPLTTETRGILDRRLIAQLPQGARLVNLARGAHLIEADLLDALDRGQLAHATLDVFGTEPLPPDHPFWQHPCINVTPHVSGFGQPEIAAEGVAENLRRLRDARPLLNVVDRERGY